MLFTLEEKADILKKALALGISIKYEKYATAVFHYNSAKQDENSLFTTESFKKLGFDNNTELVDLLDFQLKNTECTDLYSTYYNISYKDRSVIGIEDTDTVLDFLKEWIQIFSADLKTREDLENIILEDNGKVNGDNPYDGVNADFFCDQNKYKLPDSWRKEGLISKDALNKKLPEYGIKLIK